MHAKNGQQEFGIWLPRKSNEGLDNSILKPWSNQVRFRIESKFVWRLEQLWQDVTQT